METHAAFSSGIGPHESSTCFGEDVYADSFKKLEIKILWPRNPTTEHILWENLNSRGHVYPNIHCSIIYTARTWKQPRCPSTDEWIKKLWYIYTMDYNLAIKRNEFESVVVRWINLEPVKQSKSEREKQMPYINAYIYVCVYIYAGSKKMVLMNHSCKAGIETQT